MKSLREEIQTALQLQASAVGMNASAASTESVELMRRASEGAISGSELARFIDHTLLKADATEAELKKLCDEAIAHLFATVCVNSGRIADAAKHLGANPTLPIAVVGFPLGAMETASKAFETKRAIDLGAKEIDMVISIGKLKDADYDAVYADVEAVVKAAGKTPVKVILETGLLSQDEKVAGCVISKRAGAAFVKTSTGFAGSGATVADISLMRNVVGFEMGVKASGGIRSRDDALKMIAAGANRVGASASVAIVTGSTEKTQGTY